MDVHTNMYMYMNMIFIYVEDTMRRNLDHRTITGPQAASPGNLPMDVGRVLGCIDSGDIDTEKVWREAKREQ